MHLISISPTSNSFYEKAQKIFFVCSFAFFDTMSQDKIFDPYHKRLAEIEKTTKNFMFSQIKHNRFFTEELKEHSTLADAIRKKLDNVRTENLVGKISDKQTTLVNKMATNAGISFVNVNYVPYFASRDLLNSKLKKCISLYTL